MNIQQSDEYIVDQILPKHEIHLLAGPSGAGKSRWLFDTMIGWQLGESVLGYKSFPVPWVYISSDRSEDSVQRTLKKMGIQPESIPLITAWPDPDINQIMDRIDTSGAELAIIEGFGGFVDPPANGHQVRNFLGRIHKWANREKAWNGTARHRLTVIGVVESPKLKPYERYENPRQRVSGVAAWAHYTETIMLVEFSNPKTPSDPLRKFILCPRNEPGAEIDLAFDSGGHLRLAQQESVSY